MQLYSMWKPLTCTKIYSRFIGINIPVTVWTFTEIVIYKGNVDILLTSVASIEQSIFAWYGVLERLGNPLHTGKYGSSSLRPTTP